MSSICSLMLPVIKDRIQNYKIAVIITFVFTASEVLPYTKTLVISNCMKGQASTALDVGVMDMERRIFY